MSPRKLQNLCAGKWVTSAATKYSNVYNPATGEVIAEHPPSTQSEIDQIIAADKAENNVSECDDYLPEK